MSTIEPHGADSETEPRAADLPLRLETLVGPAMAPIVVEPGTVVVMGRSSGCGIQLPDSAVSRRHASLQHGPDGWTIADLESRHGTIVNGSRIEAGGSVVLRDGDVVSVGPWKFGVREGDRVAARTLMPTSDDGALSRVQRITEDEVGMLAQQRLGIIMECAAVVHSATEEAALAAGVLEAALLGSGYTRGALLRRAEAGDKVEVIGQRGGVAGASFPISRSLIQAASAGQAVRLVDQPDLRHAQSIVGTGVEQAMCVPVEVSGATGGYLYLDAGVGARIGGDAAAFCTAVARLCGMALANLGRRKMERLQAQLLEDLRAARETQQRIMPPGKGVVGPLRYAMKSVPGRLVAGDLFDVVALKDGRVAVFLGDVSGKGVGAAMVMAAAQTELRAALREHGDPAVAVWMVNNYLVAHSAPHEFVTLWVGVFDGPGGSLHWVDAGHGYWAHAMPGGMARRPVSEASLIMGIDADHDYTRREMPLSPGDRVVVFSDGVVEQVSPGGEQFGIERTLAALEGHAGPEEDVEALYAALIAHAGKSTLGDDVTIASVVVGG